MVVNGRTGRPTVLLTSNVGPIDAPALVSTYETTIDEELLDEIEFFMPIYTGPAVNLALMRRMPNLAVCQLLSAGYESALAFLPEGVTLCNAGGVHDASTAELAIGLIIASLRGIDDAARDMAAGRWDHRTRPALADCHVVVVGAGGVGRAIQRRLAPFETTVTMVGRTGRPGVRAASELVGLLPTAEVVVLALPLDSTTERSVDASFLAAMKDGALLVNVARGRVVDTDALLIELASGRLRAAMDVTDPEPLPADHPLWLQQRALITPHVGGNTSAFLPRARRLIERQVNAFLAGNDLESVVVLSGS